MLLFGLGRGLGLGLPGDLLHGWPRKAHRGRAGIRGHLGQEPGITNRVGRVLIVTDRPFGESHVIKHIKSL